MHHSNLQPNPPIEEQPRQKEEEMEIESPKEFKFSSEFIATIQVPFRSISNPSSSFVSIFSKYVLSYGTFQYCS